jgi:lysophospholipase L1-like esterase
MTPVGRHSLGTRAVLALVLVLAVCFATPALAQAHKGSKSDSQRQLYVSLGDSYAEGYQPNPAGGLGGSTKDGYAYVLPKFARKRGYDLKLVNFACGGETTTSMLERTTPCPAPAMPIGGPDYAGQTQAAAAERFIKKHRKQVGLITVSIGGNDVTSCVNNSDPFGCVGNASQTVKANIKTLVDGLRAAAGPKVRIIGLTYPDVVLGLWVSGDSNDQTLAAASVVAFRDIFNPTLKEAYESVAGTFVDITAATDAYVPLDQTTTLAPYGVIPIAVAKICQIGYFCQIRDIHLNASGYGEMAQLIADTLPKKKKNK